MKRFSFCALFFCVFLSFTNSAHAQCGVTYGCVTSFSLSPGEIMGDLSHYSTGTITDNLAPSEHGEWTVLFTVSGGPGFICVNGIPVYSQLNGCHVSGSTAEVYFFSGNGSGQTVSLPIHVQDDPDRDPGISQNLLVDTMPTTFPPDPDGPCPTGQCGSAGNPINVTNGDTWIPQQDYQMPGIAGGFTLTRTWNSLWATMGGPEEAGIFGDSWRSNIEERIQVLSGGVVNYWKGNGSSLIYNYNSLSGTYTLTAPTDDQTTLAFSTKNLIQTARCFRPCCGSLSAAYLHQTSRAWRHTMVSGWSAMAMRDITQLMNAYRECSRNLWNVYFANRENVGGSLDAFEQIRALLFDSLVVSELSYEGDAEGEDIPPPALKVVPRARSLILIKRLSGPGEAGYWDQEKDMVVGPDDITLEFVEYFDFYQVPLKDFYYYLCKILSFPRHADYEGREALLHVSDAKVFHDELAD